MTAEQRSPEWFAQRVGMVTASRSAAILGYDSFNNYASTMRAMVREYLGAESEFQGNEDTERGVLHEPDAIAALELEKEIQVRECYFQVHPEIEFMGASPDGAGSDESNVEAKCPRKIKPMDEKPGWWHQAQHQMFVTGRKFTWFIQWVDGDYQVDRIEADPTWWETYGPQLKAFHEDYLATISDPEKCQVHLDPLEATMESPEWEKLAGEWNYLSAQIKALTDRKKEIDAQLKELAGGKKSRGYGVLVYPTTRKGSVDTDKMAKDGIDVDSYRKAESISWSVKASK